MENYFNAPQPSMATWQKLKNLYEGVTHSYILPKEDKEGVYCIKFPNGLKIEMTFNDQNGADKFEELFIQLLDQRIILK